jgi:hypothetical protein
MCTAARANFDFWDQLVDAAHSAVFTGLNLPRD